jgi:hypothetical protein
VVLTNYDSVPLAFFATAPGYATTDTTRTGLCNDLCTLTVKMKRLNTPEFVLFPSVVKTNGLMNIWFTNTQDVRLANRVDVEVRTIDGRLVWKDTKYATRYEVVDFKWNLGKEREKIVPSVYFAVIRCKNKLFKKKFLIVG